MHNHTIVYSLRDNTILCNSGFVHCSMFGCAISRNALSYTVVQYCAMQYNTQLCNIVQCNAIIQLCPPQPKPGGVWGLKLMWSSCCCFTGSGMSFLFSIFIAKLFTFCSYMHMQMECIYTRVPHIQLPIFSPTYILPPPAPCLASTSNERAQALKLSASQTEAENN